MPPPAAPAPDSKPAIAREKKTVAAMVRLYCADHRHDAPDGCVCETCAALLAYSHQRLDRCPYGDDKPTCKECPIHCYTPARREEMRQVMREAGPRMLLRHPWLAVVHLWKDHFRKAPPRTRKA
jgi:hypothetical protein